MLSSKLALKKIWSIHLVELGECVNSRVATCVGFTRTVRFLDDVSRIPSAWESYTLFIMDYCTRSDIYALNLKCVSPSRWQAGSLSHSQKSVSGLNRHSPPSRLCLHTDRRRRGAEGHARIKVCWKFIILMNMGEGESGWKGEQLRKYVHLVDWLGH